MLDRIKRWLAGQRSYPQVSFDGEGEFFEPGEHARLVQQVLDVAGERVDRVRDLVAPKGRLAIEIERSGLVLRVTSENAAGESDWCDMGVVLAALNEAAEIFGLRRRFGGLPTGDQGMIIAAFPVDDLPRIRDALELELPHRDVAGVMLYPAGTSVHEGDLYVSSSEGRNLLGRHQVVTGDLVPDEMLEDLRGCEGVIAVSSLAITGSALRDLRGLGGLRFAGDILVHDNAKLASLAGLDALERVLGSITLTANPVLRDVSALERVVEAGDLVLEANPLLSRAPGPRMRSFDPALVLEAREIPIRCPTRIEGVLVRDRAVFGLDGRLEEATLAEDTRLGSWTARAGTALTLSFSLPESLTLAAPCRADGVDLPAGTRVCFWGRTVDRLETPIASATLDEDRAVRGRVFPRGTELNFDEDGELSYAIVPEAAWVRWRDGAWKQDPE